MQDAFGKLVHSVGLTQSKFAIHSVSFKPHFTFIGTAVHRTGSFMGHVASGSVHAVTHTAHNVTHFADSATNINTYIKTADYAHVPVITPVPVAKVATTSQPAAAVVAAPAPAPTPTPGVINTTAAPDLPVFDTTNTYAWGNCTYWVSYRRAQVGDPIPNSWGNAATWAPRAAQDGYLVDHHPSPGAIMQTPYSAGGLGHVAYVESVDQDGTWHISEMNVLGLDVVDHRSLTALAAADYSFIHDR
jgi:surface antigen